MKTTLLLLSIIFSASAIAAEEVNVYSYRKPVLIQPMFDAFTDTTGIKVNVVHAKKGLIERLKREDRNTPADLVLTVGFGRLEDLKQAGLTQAVQSASLESNIPAYARDKNNFWYGLTERARFIVVSKDRVKPGEIKRYEDLTDPKWKGRICTRSGKNAYMTSLTATMITHLGVDGAEKWLSGLKNNLARKPQGNDRAQVKAIKEGVCDVAIINHYYMQKMIKDEEQKTWADAINVVFPNQEDRGTHTNISGMTMTLHAKNKTNALKLMEFLASNKAQDMFTQINGEYPVNPDIELADSLKPWGNFKKDTIGFDEIAKHRSEAVKMTDRVAYDG